MEKILSKIKSGGSFSVVIFGIFVVFSVAKGEGCGNLKDRANVEFGFEDDREPSEPADAGNR